MTKRTFPRTKLATLEQAAAQAEKWRAAGETVAFTNGCFDLLHPGHVSCIRQAREAADHLIVGMNTDESVKRLKGPARPVHDQDARATILSALETVDMVVLFGYPEDNDTPVECLKAIRPDFLVKGGQYKFEEVVGYEIVTGYGGKILRAQMEEGLSTTNTIRKMGGGGQPESCASPER